MRYDVWGLGTLARDVLMKVDALPAEDGFCIVEESQSQPGGSGTNVMVQLARLGAKCGYSGAVGDDALGRQVLDSLKREGVDTSAMVIRPGMTTLHTDIVIDKEGRKFIMLNMGEAFASLKSEEVPEHKLREAKVFYTDLLPQKPSVEALKKARRAGVSTVFNLQVGLSTMKGLGVSREEILQALAYADVFAPCREGLYQLAGTESLEECRDFLRKYCNGILLFTLGTQGSVAYGPAGQGSWPVKVQAEKIQAVDTTGAGDSYIGGFIYSYFLEKRELKEAMKFASACAAYTCTGLGARFSPTLEEVKNFA